MPREETDRQTDRHNGQTDGQAGRQTDRGETLVPTTTIATAVAEGGEVAVAAHGGHVRRRTAQCEEDEEEESRADRNLHRCCFVVFS